MEWTGLISCTIHSSLIEYFNMGIDRKIPSPEIAKNPMSGKDLDTKEREEHCESF